MSQNQIKRLTLTQLKRKLNELSKDEIIELFVEVLKEDKKAWNSVAVKFQGETAVLELLKEYKEKIRKEFDPPRGMPIKKAGSYPPKVRQKMHKVVSAYR